MFMSAPLQGHCRARISVLKSLAMNKQVPATRSIIKIVAIIFLLVLAAGCKPTPPPTVILTPPSATPTPTATLPPPSTTLRLVGYFFGSDTSNNTADIAADKLSAVLYAFIDVSDTGECVSIAERAATDQRNFTQLKQLKQQHPSLKTLISLGGYDHSTYFSDAALTPAARQHFAQSCIQFMTQNGFDGIDIDWELPVRGGKAGNVHHPEDKQNFTALLAEFRRQLDALGASNQQHYLLTIAGPAGSSEYANIELNIIPQYLDWINLETYAYATEASPLTNFNAPLYPSSSDPSPQQRRLTANGDAAVRGYLAANVPANKILLGVSFYARGWQSVPDANHGLYQPDSGAVNDTTVPKGTWQSGATSYENLAKYYLPTYSHYWQDEAKEPWLYNPSTQIMITYEDSQSLGIKADYVRTNQLGGMMVWHLGDDDAQHSLLQTLYAHLFQ